MRRHNATKVLTLALAATFWMPGAMSAQTATQPGDGTQAAAANSPSQGQSPASGTQQKPPAGGPSVNPSQAPLQPVTTYPDAAGNAQSQNPAGPPDAPQPQQPKQSSTEPQGAATAERVPTAGASAAKPAGVAIAPAKQHRTRSLLIKFGAVAAAGVAAGTVYALSRGTSSNPPGTNTPGAVPK
jgi:hypothetical protein